MKNTTIQLTPEAKRELAIIKYQLESKDYSETILRMITIVKEIITAKAVASPSSSNNPKSNDYLSFMAGRRSLLLPHQEKQVGSNPAPATMRKENSK